MKHVKCSEKTRSKRGVFFGSLLTIVLSCVLFVGVTLAWFSATYSAPQITMKAANFDAELTVVKDGNQHTIANSYELENGTYELTLKRIGTSSESRGYCRIAIGDTVYRSPYLTKDVTFAFTLTLNLTEGESVRVTCTPVWGNVTTEDSDLPEITNDGTIEYGTILD